MTISKPNEKKSFAELGKQNISLFSKSKKSSTSQEEKQASEAMAGQATQRAIEANENDALLAAALFDSKLISKLDLEKALAKKSHQNIRLTETLLKEGFVSEEVLFDFLCKYRKLPAVDLINVQPESDVAALLPESMARSFRAVAFSVDGGSTSVAVTDELLGTEVGALLGAVGGVVQFHLAPPSQVQRLLDKQHRATDSVSELVKSFESIEIMRRGAIDDTNDVAASEDAPVVQVVARILTQAVRDRASDVHIEPKKNEVRVRFRIDGVLTTVLELPVAMGPSLVSRIKVMAQMNIVERRRPQDGQFGVEVDGHSVDVRVATIATIWGEHCTMRILEKSRSVMTLADLGMPQDTYEKFIRVVRSPSGMVLCTGPTGSGKTTTLYAVLSEVVDGTRNIMTIEDPVEYVLPSINQIQTNDQAGLSFATGLRSILRQDPDVILVGEIRDVETARIAVQSALTGHSVLSSVHATDAVSALHRFLDMGIESFLISSSITGIVGQRLLRMMCSHCKVAYKPTAEELELYKATGLAIKETFYIGEGCNFCSGTGFHGRVGVFEFLQVTSEIKRLVAAFAPQDQLQEMAEKEGMRTLRQEAYRLVERDLTTISEVIRSTYTL